VKIKGQVEVNSKGNIFSEEVLQKNPQTKEWSRKSEKSR